MTLLAIVKSYILTWLKHYYFTDRKKLAAWQYKKSREIVKFAIKNSPFYRSYYSKSYLGDWQTLPIMDKSVLMANFSTLNTVQLSYDATLAVAIKAESSRDFKPTLKGMTVGLSSGTSGNRGLFVVSEAERLAWAGSVMAKLLGRKILAPQKIAFFLRADSNIYTSLKMKRIEFAFYDLFDDIARHIAALNQYQPSILIAPPSMLLILAAHIARHTLLIRPLTIVSVAEVLEPSDKTVIEKAFGQTVQQVYQATEGFIATTCAEGILHLNEDILLVEKEYIDQAQGKFVPIITDLYRKALPIIRYRLNDILTERSSPCPCGSIYTALEQIDGRCDDLFYIERIDTTELKPLFPDFIRKAVITSTEIIDEFAVIQKSPRLLEVNLQCQAQHLLTAQKKVQLNIETLFASLGAVRPTVSFGKFVAPKTGDKMRRIRRDFPLI